MLTLLKTINTVESVLIKQNSESNNGNVVMRKKMHCFACRLRVLLHNTQVDSTYFINYVINMIVDISLL